MFYTQNADICAAELDGEICLFNPATAEYLNLNGPASTIWNLLSEPSDEETVVIALRKIYDVAEEICRLDTREFLGEALEKGMVEACEP
jgi:hypothetical protein